MTDRMLLFVAPEAADRAFRRVAAGLGEDPPHEFHSMLLLKPETGLVTWSIRQEVEVLGEVAVAGRLWDLVGYSGGAAMCLAFAETYLDRVASLTLIEPPWIGNDTWSEEEAVFAARFNALLGLDDRATYTGFTELFAPGVVPHATDDPVFVARMARALRAVWRGYRTTSLDRTYLSRFRGPVLLPLGDRSNPRMAAQARLLEAVFPHARVLRLAGAHHFDILTAGAVAMAEAITALRRD
jgi:pimeloyl-ACP methyl ester carboxylesterase